MGTVALVVQPQVFDHLLHHGELIVGVEDQVVVGKSGSLGLAAQDARAGGVERADGQRLRRVVAEHLVQPGAHLAGGLVGEGDGEDVPRRDAHLRQHPGDAVGEHAGLPGPRPGEHQHGAIRRGNGSLLLRVECLQEWMGLVVHRFYSTA